MNSNLEPRTRWVFGAFFLIADNAGFGEYIQMRYSEMHDPLFRSRRALGHGSIKNVRGHELYVNFVVGMSIYFKWRENH